MTCLKLTCVTSLISYHSVKPKTQNLKKSAEELSDVESVARVAEIVALVAYQAA